MVDIAAAADPAEVVAAPGKTMRQTSREANNRRRREERDLELPPVVNPARRQRCLDDIYEFLPTYFPRYFRGPFTQARREIVDVIVRAARFGSDQALAAPRGVGKTTIVMGATIYCILKGWVRFAVLVAANGPKSEQMLDNIKSELERNTALLEDFPEIMAPIHALEGVSQRGRLQTVNGERTYLVWHKDLIVFPTVAGSVASGAVISTYGLDAAIRGVNREGMRPDLVIIDDPETRESAASETQCLTRELIIDNDIAGMGGPGEKISRLILTTIQNRECVSFRYTDPKQKPSWNGRRMALLACWPERADLWEEYVIIRQTGMESGQDVAGRGATRHYLDHRAEMDAGHVCSDPERYIRTLLEDGEPMEISALQHCYNIIADKGLDTFLTEYQNDPPKDEGPEDSGINATLVRHRLSRIPRGIIPEGTEVLTAGIDIGKRLAHYVIGAWQTGALGSVVEYGVIELHGSDSPTASQGQVERAIRNGLHHWREELLANPLKDSRDEAWDLDCVLIDSGYCEDAVFAFVRESGGRIYRAAKGFGEGQTRANFHSPEQASATRVPGDHWFASLQQTKNCWLFHIDADHWKRWTHHRFLTPSHEDDGRRRAGSLALYGEDPREHVAYSKHVTAEIEKEQFEEGKGVKRWWERESRNNHYLDATALMCAAASMRGIKLLGSGRTHVPVPAPAAPTPRIHGRLKSSRQFFLRRHR